MGQLDHRATVSRRRRRGFFSGGWIDFTFEPLERRYLMSASGTVIDLPLSAPTDPAAHMPKNLDGSTDASDGLIGFATRINEENKTTFTDALASFTDDRGGSAQDFVAKIDWDDGSDSDGTIVANRKGGFDVIGTHAYPF